VARVRSDGFDADTQSKSDLRVRPVLAQQRQHIALARREQRLTGLNVPAGGKKL
jgi:hypothetical protein